MKNFKINLPILFYTEEGIKAKELGYEIKDDTEIREITFYQITAISESRIEKGQTTIYVPGDSFLCNLPKKEVEELIDKQLIT